MSLRARLVAVALVLTALVVVLMAVIVIRQRGILTDQIDDQLRVVAEASSRRIESGIVRTELLPADERDASIGDLYLAAISSDGVLIVLAEPLSGTVITPDVGAAQSLAQAASSDGGQLTATTMDWDQGGAGVRTVAIDVGLDRVFVVARSTEEVDESQNELLLAFALALAAIVATLGLALWWIDRLGLQPIRRLTSAAEDVASGRSDRRVAHASSATETGRLGAAFNEMLDARQQAEVRQRQFVADASHELRTPLTALRGYADLYFGGGLESPEAVDDAMRRIQIESARMSALTEDLLTLASLDEGRPLELSEVDLAQLLRDIASDAAVIQPARTVDCDGVSSELVVQADRNLLTQALSAATTNALRHTPVEAGLFIAADAMPGADGQATVRVTVADDGPGVSPEQIESLFDRFYRGDSGRDTSRGGRGLGLSIAQRVVEAHGGTISASSASEGGLVIAIALPCVSAHR